MTTLSARHFGFLKYPFPFVVVLGACAWTYWSDIRKGEPMSIWVYFLGAAVVASIVVIVFRRGPWSMADTVELMDETLLVRRWTTTERISLSDVRGITWAPSVVGCMVTLELSQPSAFGAAVRFLAPDTRKVPTIQNDLELLAARVGSKRANNVA